MHCRHCWVDAAAIEQGWGPKASARADEHYIPTLLASLGKEDETDCRVGLPVPLEPASSPHTTARDPPPLWQAHCASDWAGTSVRDWHTEPVRKAASCGISFSRDVRK